jgi:hypothetical protein
MFDTLGFDTTLIERRVDGNTRVAAEDHHVALIGVDNVSTRRLISQVGWRLAIDVGLGAGPADFNAVTLRRFPGLRTSDEISAWSASPPATKAVPDLPAFTDLANRDRCGVVEVAGTAVGASFVGAIAACLAVAEAVRDTLDGTGHDAVSLHLQSLDLETAPAAAPAEVVPAPLVR